MNNVLKVVFSLMFFLSFSVFSAEKILVGVPHFSEFSDAENSNGYYYCGHTALKIAQMYKGRTKTLDQIHQIFLKNSPSGYGSDTYCYTSNKHRCAKLQDLAWAQYVKNGGYGTVSDSVGTSNYDLLNMRGPFSNSTDFYNKVKNSIDLGHTVISPSSVVYNDAGHFWVIVGYKDVINSTTKVVDTANSTIYLRDVALRSPNYANYDRTYIVSSFFDKATTSSGSLKGQLLIVR